MIDEITRAVLSRKRSRGISARRPWRERSSRTRADRSYLDELKTTQRISIYRALKHPLYPILRKVERIGEHFEAVKAATRGGRVVYASTTAVTPTTWSNRSCSTTTVSGHRLLRPESICLAARSA